jgi:uncharacterized delta-60 repeat protein
MKKLQSTIVRLLFLAALFVTGANGNLVPLDTTFNGTGYSIQEPAPNPAGSYGTSFAIQPDGKIVLGGYTHIMNGGTSDKFAVMRLNANGTPDMTFGTGGSTTTQVGTHIYAIKLLLQPDGKIVLLGASWGGDATSYDITILRYTSGGVLDTTFNSTGFRTHNISGASYDGASDMLLLPDGKLLVVGNTSANGNAQGDIVLMRINTDGSLDATFDGDGVLVVANPEAETAYTAILLADGKILTGGSRNNGGNDKLLLMRFNSNGTLDTTFGTGGSTTTTAGTGIVYFTSMNLQSDGKIVASGLGLIARYTSGGTLDTTFAGGGITDIPIVSDAYEILIAPDDKILLATRFGANAGVARLLPNGYSDTNFNNGARNIFIPGGSCIAYDIDFQSDGKIVLGGYCYSNDIAKFAVWRVQEIRTKRHLDFDGNETTEFSLFRPSTGEWFYTPATSFQNSTITAQQWGVSTDRPVPADYTGDGRTDFAVFRPSIGEWFIIRSENGTTYSFPFGSTGDVPVPADYDGDYKADVAVFRPSTGDWYLWKSSDGLTTITTFGTSGDNPVPSDYDGDFKTDIAIYRPSVGEWWIQKSSDSSVYAFQFGNASDKPVQGDYTGDNKTDAAFWRPSTGEWFILRSEDFSYYSVPFGLNGDLPAPGNYGGDGRFDFVIFRPSENQWHVQYAEGTYFRRVFGLAGDQPLPNYFVP